ncbi:hypothetical protein H0I23_02030 [Cellulophaga sp. HaHaR_3_176]|uniref:DUF3244 domain-containing protein n=1 Tax=Cellulophaga sp. HaHaR_3_176 TaxID=1942464 RepID=UPI001C1F7380|nr:hypothetical protein [Cellulophaga sp. HaHaR_3_176]QWX84450.1 hypothetical protein H0I23_02030 [Cellulophaga sp. HaHaR_3_176]
MKTVLKITVMAALMFNTLIASANSEPKIYVAGENAEKSLIFELDVTSENTKIQLIDSENNIIYSDNALSSTGVRKKFDLSKLTSGVYTFKVDNSVKAITYQILLASNEMTILNKDEKVKAVFRKKNGLVYVNLLNVDKSDVVIKVYDSSSRLLFTEVVSDSLIVEKAINFTGAHKGQYTISVKDGSEKYSENISI